MPTTYLVYDVSASPAALCRLSVPAADSVNGLAVDATLKRLVPGGAADVVVPNYAGASKYEWSLTDLDAAYRLTVFATSGIDGPDALELDIALTQDGAPVELTEGDLPIASTKKVEHNFHFPRIEMILGETS